LRNRTIFSDGVAYHAGAQPKMFASMAAVHGIGAFLFGWMSATALPAFCSLFGRADPGGPCGHCETGFAIRSG
jgi:hypothetical protein